MKKPSIAHLQVLLAAAIGGFSGIFVKLIELPATSITFFRLFVPTIIIFFILKQKPNIFSWRNKNMLIASLLNAMRIFLLFLGYTATTVTNGVIIAFFWPIFSALLGIFLLKEKPNLRTIALFVLAFFGMLTMYWNKGFSLQNNDTVGVLLILISAFIYAITVIIYKKEANNYEPLETVFYQNLVGAAIFTPIFFMTRPFPTLIETSSSIIYGCILGVIGFYLFFSGLKKLSVSEFSLLCYFEVPAGILYGSLIFHEQLTWNIALGGAMILFSSMAIRRP